MSKESVTSKTVTIGLVQAVAEAAWGVLNHDNDPHDGQSYNTKNWHDLTRAIRNALERRFPVETTVCRWLRSDSGDGHLSAFVEANCGVSFHIPKGTERGYKFCPACGKQTAWLGSSPEEPDGRLPAAFQSLLDLQPNWDSYGAKRINRECVQKAYEIWKQLAGTWLPVPHSDGTVGLEQHQGGFDIEIDVDLSLSPENGSETTKVTK